MGRRPEEVYGLLSADVHETHKLWGEWGGYAGLFHRNSLITEFSTYMFQLTF